MQKLYSVSETVTKNVRTGGDAGSRFDGRKNAGHAVMFPHDARLLFHLRKRRRSTTWSYTVLISFNWQFALVGLQLRILNGVVSLLTT